VRATMAGDSTRDARQHAENLFRLGRKPKSVLRCCQRLGLKASSKSVYRWAEQFRQSGSVQKRKAGSGRKKRIRGALLGGLFRAARGEGFSARKWAREHNLAFETVRETLTKDPSRALVARVRAKKPLLTPINKQKRVDFATEYKDKTKRFWRKVTFTDSKYFGIGAGGRLYAWVKRGERAPNVPRVPREGPRVRVYAALNATGVSEPVILRGKNMTVTADLYVCKVLPRLVEYSRQSLGSWSATRIYAGWCACPHCSQNHTVDGQL